MITVLFSCRACGLKDASVQVPARETPDDDVIHWMKEVVPYCIQDEHRRRSPHCTHNSASDVKIPMPPEAEFLGQQIE